MGTPAQELEAKLAQFESLHPSEGAQLRSMVSGSPELSSLLLNAIGKGNLDGGFQPLSAAERSGTLGIFDADSETMSLPMDLLGSSKAEDANTLLSTIGHEAAHAINKDAIRTTFAQFDIDLASVASGPPPRDYTSTVKGFLDGSRSREASDEIGGVNVLAAKIARENPGASKEQLYRALYESTDDVRDYFDVSGTGGNKVYTPKPGITFNDTLQIEPTAANVEAFGKYFFDARGYPANYGQSVINHAGTVEAKAQATELAKDPSRAPTHATVDLHALGIDPTKVSLPSGMVSGTAPRPAAPALAPATEEQAKPLSSTDDRLLQDSERFVRQTALKHHLPWDAGMDNTVNAMACSAKKAGMTGITHFKAADGELRFAQHDGHTLKEATLDAQTAANTPAEQSREALVALDRSLADAPPPTVQQRTLEAELTHTR